MKWGVPVLRQWAAASLTHFTTAKRSFPSHWMVFIP